MTTTELVPIPPPPSEPGSYVLREGQWVPNPDDDAMVARLAGAQSPKEE